MRYHILLKFCAIILCAAALLAALACGGGILALAEMGLYTQSIEEMQQNRLESRLYTLADVLAQRYTAGQHSDLPQEALDMYFTQFYYWESWLGEDQWSYTLRDLDGQVLEEGGDKHPGDLIQRFEYVMVPEFPVFFSTEDIDGITMIPVETTEATVPLTGYGPRFCYVDSQEQYHEYDVRYGQGEAVQVTLLLKVGADTLVDPELWQIAEFGYAHRFDLIWGLAAALLVFALLTVYLCCAAGRKPGRDEAQPAGLNRLPLDLYAAVAGVAVAALAFGCYELAVWNLEYFDPMWLMGLLIGAMAYAGCLLVVCFFFALAAQVKAGLWWRRSVIAWAIRLCWKLLKWIFGLLRRILGWLKRHTPPALKGVWNFVRKLVGGIFGLIGKAFGWVWKCVRRFAALLPLTWQFLLTGFLLVFILLISLQARPVGQLLGVGACIALVAYGAHCFGVLLESTRRMSQGQLDTKVDDKLLLGGFQEYATSLNALADVAVEAARKQMKSERMKAELVTNVSHDIKTPLTSIINYVDLLQKAETQEQAQEYLEVLGRQSQRLKKLIEDLMEMSKASTGNMAVELTAVDAGEAITQALGEFADKLESASLTPVFLPPKEPIRMMADGRLTWRVLSNLLSNAVKYALPGTRLYIDLVKLEGQVLISLKNISREPLNISTDELMERFVRGDEARNTEGSGLGLNIARSLMELQKGQLQLLVDGDLFKATLIFPEQP